MSDWAAGKNLGPWAFTKQRNKFGYNNNPTWSYPATRTHIPCGHWHKPTTLPPTSLVPTTFIVDDIYVIHGAPMGGGGTALKDRCYRRSKDLAEVDWYGGQGAGDDELWCPFGVAVDEDYIWIVDTTNSRLMQRLKLDLSYVNQRTSYLRHSVHSGSGNFIWTGFTSRIDELNKSDLTTNRSIVWPACGVEGFPGYATDITSDDNYLYVSDASGNRVIVYDINTLLFDREFGTYSYWMVSCQGLGYNLGFLYVADTTGTKVHKVDASDYSVVASYGHSNGGSGAGYISPNELYCFGSRVFIADSTNGVVQVLDNNLNFITELSAGLTWPWSVAVDANYIYVLDQGGFIVRFDSTTYAFVDSTVFGSGTLYGMTIDGIYIYVLDQSIDLDILRINKATMAYVDKYSDVGWAVFTNPQSICVDGTYIYVSDNSNMHRVNKATMAYVDINNLSDTTTAMQASVDSGSLYVADFNGGVQNYNLATFALIDKSPATRGDPDYWLDYPSGITCDEDYLYVADSVLMEIKIYEKSTGIYVDKFAVPTQPEHIAVDDSYLYVAIYNDILGTSYTKKYLKVSPFTEVGSADEEYCTSVDTMYIYQV